jgi:hypothetical protein
VPLNLGSERVKELLEGAAQASSVKRQFEHSQSELSLELTAKQGKIAELAGRVDELQRRCEPLEARASQCEWKCKSAVLEREVRNFRSVFTLL